MNRLVGRGGRGQDTADSVSTRRLTLVPLVAAAVVLILWLAWLLVPDTARRDLLGAPGAAPEALPTWDSGLPVDDGPEAESDQDPEPLAAVEEEAPEALEAEPEEVEPEPPAPVVVPVQGDGDFDIAAGSSEVVGDGELVSYIVEVEGGLPFVPAEVAEIVDAVLRDSRSWTSEGEWSLQRTDDPAEAEARILFASPNTTDELCAPLQTNGEVSCRNGENVVLNGLRWNEGAESWGQDLTGYRHYLINHEFGHFLGEGHENCPAAGELAPIMVQQTLGLQGCEPNAWPYP